MAYDKHSPVNGSCNTPKSARTTFPDGCFHRTERIGWGMITQKCNLHPGCCTEQPPPPIEQPPPPPPPIGGNFRTNQGNKSGTTLSRFSARLLTTQLPTDLDLGPSPQTHLSFDCCTIRVTWKPTCPHFQKNKNCSTSGLYMVLDQCQGTKLSDLVVRAQVLDALMPVKNYRCSLLCSRLQPTCPCCTGASKWLHSQ